MSVDDDKLSIVASVKTEVEGYLLANILGEYDIPAVVTGGATAEYRATAPGSVQVLVSQSRLPEAQAILAKRAPHTSRDVLVADDASSDYQSRLTSFKLCGLFYAQIMSIAAIVMYWSTGGDLTTGLLALVLTLVITLAVLTRWPFAGCRTT